MGCSRGPRKVPIPFGGQLWPSYTAPSEADVNTIFRSRDNIVQVAATKIGSVENHTVFPGRLYFKFRKDQVP